MERQWLMVVAFFAIIRLKEEIQIHQSHQGESELS
jgi:hypothetical protein